MEILEAAGGCKMRMYWLFVAVLWIAASAYYAYNDKDMWSFFFAGSAIFAMGIHAIINAIESLGK